jgi:hypothetical protein
MNYEQSYVREGRVFIPMREECVHILLSLYLRLQVILARACYSAACAVTVDFCFDISLCSHRHADHDSRRDQAH